jgi:peptide-methionine (R)-S-oxide reductase
VKPSFIGAAAVATILLGIACAAPSFQTQATPHKYKVVKSDAEWKKELSPEAYDVLRHSGTEPAFSNPMEHNHAVGIYYCAGCGTPLFSSKTKFDSGTGWPSFFKPIAKNAVFTRSDSSLGMQRDEVVCGTCGGHLGHVFDDGPAPTGLRYCMNGAALKFKKGPTELKEEPKAKAKP